VATLYLIGYGLMAVFALLGRLKIVLELARWGFFFAAMLTYLEAFVLEKWCIYCLWSQGIVTAILLVTTGVVVWEWFKSRRVLQKVV
jgi:vitamin-K-epoxide reductase (warfarin-sensitive)